MEKALLSLSFLPALLLPGPRDAAAHCQVPCGIYDDEAELSAFDPELEAEDEQAYFEFLKLAHHITFYAMKCKQTVDLGNVARLQEACDAFAAASGKAK